jgi:hypothetical protein
MRGSLVLSRRGDRNIRGSVIEIDSADSNSRKALLAPLLTHLVGHQPEGRLRRQFPHMRTM